MKKIQLKFAAQQMTKEQMKNVKGGSLEQRECSATILCASGIRVGGQADCDDNSGSSESNGICQSKSGASNDYSISCDCTDN